MSWRVPLAAVRHKDYERRAAQISSSATTPCLLCGDPVSPPWNHVVQLVDGGATIVPEDAQVDVTDPGYVGCWPVGGRCWQKLMAAARGGRP